MRSFVASRVVTVLKISPLFFDRFLFRLDRWLRAVHLDRLDMMSDPEVCLAASYRSLYGRLGLDNVAPTTEDAVKEDESVVASSGTTVTEAVWTDEDATKAAMILQAYQDKCLITTPIQESEQDSWNRFYQAHRANFFNDKHYLQTDFPHEFTVTSDNNQHTRCCVEIGCGVGNAVLPLLDPKQDGTDSDMDWTLHCIDLSPVAIDLLRQDARFLRASQSQRAFGYCCDITQPQQLPETCIHVASVTTAFFCLSAIDPALHLVAAQTVARTLARGGVLVIRDYGRYDEGQLKLGLQRNKLVKDHFYRKFDGTKCFYFTLEELRDLFVDKCGLEELELRYLCKLFENRSQQTKRKRVWVSARFRMPLK